MRIKISVCQDCPFMSNDMSHDICNLSFLETNGDYRLKSVITMPEWCPLKKEEYTFFTEESDSQKDIPEEFKKKMDELQNQVSSLEDLGSKLKDLYKNLE